MNTDLARWLGKQAAALVRTTTERSRRLRLRDDDGAQARAALHEGPPVVARQLPPRYGMTSARGKRSVLD